MGPEVAQLNEVNQHLSDIPGFVNQTHDAVQFVAGTVGLDAELEDLSCRHRTIELRVYGAENSFHDVRPMLLHQICDR